MASMRILIPAIKYRRDLRRVGKRNWDLEKIKTILRLLGMGLQLPRSARPHKLSGEYAGLCECHIEPDWLLVYDVTDTEVLLVRTGTHADLFE